MEWQETVSLWPSLVSLKGLKDGAEGGALWDTDSVCDIGQGIHGELGLGWLQPWSPQSLLPPSLLTQPSRDRGTAHGAESLEFNREGNSKATCGDRGWVGLNEPLDSVGTPVAPPAPHCVPLSPRGAAVAGDPGRSSL